MDKLNKVPISSKQWGLTLLIRHLRHSRQLKVRLRVNTIYSLTNWTKGTAQHVFDETVTRGKKINIVFFNTGMRSKVEGTLYYCPSAHPEVSVFSIYSNFILSHWKIIDRKGIMSDITHNSNNKPYY